MNRRLLLVLATVLALPSGASAQSWYPITSVDSDPSMGLALNNSRICHRDSDQDLHVVYDRGGDIVHGVKSAGTWDTTQLIPSHVGGAISIPTMAWLPGTDKVIVGWLEQAGGTDYIVTRLSSNGGVNWSNPACVVRSAPITSHAEVLSQLTLDYGYGSEGEEIAAACWRYDQDRVQCTQWETPNCPGGYWSNVSGGPGENPSVDLREGMTHVVWDSPSQETGSQMVRYRRFNGATWSAIQTLADPGNDPAVMVRPNGGTIYVGYHVGASGGAPPAIYGLTSTTTGASWSFPASAGPGGYMGDGFFARPITANAPADVLFAWEEVASVGKIPGLAYVDDDFAAMTPASMPGATGQADSLFNTACMNNGFIDYFWIWNDGLGTDYLRHRPAAY